MNYISVKTDSFCYTITMIVSLWVVCLCSLYINLGHADEEVYVTIPQGSLVGLKVTTNYLNKTYYSFKGIPYVKPMLGENKFDPPRPPEPWKGLFNAKEHGEICTQYNAVFEYVEGSDDCLSLNLYTPDINPKKCKAVMIFIPGAGFNFLRSDYDFFGGDYLIENDVILVTINYRIGPIGFLSTNDEHAPGNVGLKDQVYAIRWVRNNVKYFGGCPDNIIIQGSDAGSVSVGYHLLSPMSRGLFQGAIMHSGSLSDYWGFHRDPRSYAFEFGRRLGIDTNDSKVLMDFLKKVPSNDLIAMTAKLFSITDDLPNTDFFFIPCADTKVEGEEQFLSDEPYTLLLKGDVADVPIIVGVTEEETASCFSSLINFTMLVKTDNYTIREKFMVRPFTGFTDPKKRAEFYQDMYKFYFGDTPLANITIEQMKTMTADLLFLSQHHISSLILNQQIKSNVYKYAFVYRSDEAASRMLIPSGNVSTHGDELEYIFFGELYSIVPEPNTNEYRMLHLMTKMWTNFAKHGDPTAVMDDIVNFKWKPTGDENNVLYIDVYPKMGSTLFPERMAFWVQKLKHMFGKFVNILI